jgi:hypothetical protein
MGSFLLVEDARVELMEPFGAGEGLDVDDHAGLVVKAPRENGCAHESIRGLRRRPPCLVSMAGQVSSMTGLSAMTYRAITSTMPHFDRSSWRGRGAAASSFTSRPHTFFYLLRWSYSVVRSAGSSRGLDASAQLAE